MRALRDGDPARRDRAEVVVFLSELSALMSGRQRARLGSGFVRESEQRAGAGAGSLAQVQEPAHALADSTHDARWQGADELIQVRLVHGGDL